MKRGSVHDALGDDDVAGDVLLATGIELAAAGDEGDPLIVVGLFFRPDDVAHGYVVAVVTFVGDDGVAVLGAVLHHDEYLVAFGALRETDKGRRNAVIVHVGGEDGVAAPAGLVVDVVPADRSVLVLGRIEFVAVVDRELFERGIDVEAGDLEAGNGAVKRCGRGCGGRRGRAGWGRCRRRGLGWRRRGIGLLGIAARTGDASDQKNGAKGEDRERESASKLHVAAPSLW